MYRTSKYKQKETGTGNSRLNIVLAIVFLLTISIIIRLVIIQGFSHDLYAAMALDQHQMTAILSPTRGRIFINGENIKNEPTLYPIATNKDFALLYAVPKDIEDPQKTAELIYERIDAQEVALAVDKILAESEEFSPEALKALEGEAKEERLEYLKIKKELEIKRLREEKIKEYAGKLSKSNDPYEPIKRKLEEDLALSIKEETGKGMDYIMETLRFYPEYNIGSHIIGFVGYEEDKEVGRYGLEGFFNEELTGKFGQIRTERSAQGELIIINDREFVKPVDGSDLILTINRSMQFAVCKKLNESVKKHGAETGTVIVMEPYSGAIMAMCSWPDYDPNFFNEVEDPNNFNNPAIFADYEPGSIFKIITMAAGIDQGKVKPDTTYEDKGFIMVEGWPKPIKNSDFSTFGPHGVVDMVSVLELSLNTGAIFVMNNTSAEKFSEYVIKFGFGDKTGIELETEGLTNVASLKRNKIRPVEAATASFGQGITVTPLQMATAYSVVANGGILMKPYLVDEIVAPNGERLKTQPQQIRRVISEKTALLVSGMMVNVVDGGHAKLAAVNGYYVAGKTGTAQVHDKEKGGYLENYWIHTFVGFAPVEEPKFVMLVKLDNPKDVNFSASSAAPLFADIAEFILNYLKVPKDR